MVVLKLPRLGDTLLFIVKCRIAASIIRFRCHPSSKTPLQLLTDHLALPLGIQVFLSIRAFIDYFMSYGCWIDFFGDCFSLSGLCTGLYRYCRMKEHLVVDLWIFADVLFEEWLDFEGFSFLFSKFWIGIDLIWANDYGFPVYLNDQSIVYTWGRQEMRVTLDLWLVDCRWNSEIVSFPLRTTICNLGSRRFKFC